MIDTPGLEVWRSLFMPYYYTGVCIVFVGIDVTKHCTLKESDDWIQRTRENCDKYLNRGLKKKRPYPVFVAVGNKIDLVKERVITTEEAREHYASMNPPIPYFETSAITGEGVDNLFKSVIRLWINHKMLAMEMINNDNDNEDDDDDDERVKVKKEPKLEISQPDDPDKCIIC